MDFKLKHSILPWILASLFVLISADSFNPYPGVYLVHRETLPDQRYNYYAQPNSRNIYAIPRRSDNLNYVNGEVPTQKAGKNVKTTIKVNEALKIKGTEIKDNGDKRNRSSRALSDEAKRALRQAQKQRPGLFWTLARVTFETFNDTRSAWNQIGDIINDSFSPDPVPIKKNSKGAAKVSSIAKPKSNNKSASNTTTSSGGATTSTTEEPFKLTRTGFQDIIRRNVKGLVRLFNIEWKDAWKQSSSTTSELQRSLGKQIFSFLQDNPDAY